jgi:hypothetical protein
MSVTPYHIHDVQEIPVRQTVTSQRIEVWTKVNDHDAILQFGPYYVGNCGNKPDLGNNAGAGTTQGKITRVSKTRWEVELPAGSIGHLFDISNPSKGVDLGYYYFSLKAEVVVN